MSGSQAGWPPQARSAWAAYRKVNQAPPQAILDLAVAFEPLLTAYLDQGLAPAAQAASEGRYDDTVAQYSDHIAPLAPRVAQAMAALTDAEDAERLGCGYMLRGSEPEPL